MLDLPELRPAGERCIAALADRLGEDRLTLDPSRRLDASRDHAWLSPVLSGALPDVTADVVVRPRCDEEVAATLAVAHDHQAAVTARGKGTGNYGQAVPLAAGIVIDSSALDEVLDVGDGWIHARAGTPFTTLETVARQHGQELAMFPSTVTSLLGGFLAGGAGGTGSIENGFLWDGYVHELEVLPCWEIPEPIVHGDAGARAHLHAYGTTGFILAARVALRPARQWTALWASFPCFGSAAAAGGCLLDLEPLPRNLSVDDAELVALLTRHAAVPAGRAGLRAIVDQSTVGAAGAVVTAHGGTVDLVDPQAVPLLVSLSFNHVTLRAKRARPWICHLQVGGDALVSRCDEARGVLPDGMLHLDARSTHGTTGFGGLLLSRFVDEPTLRAGMDELRALGVHVIDPHTWSLAGNGDLSATVAAAREYDHHGLLNPGKLPRD